MRNVLITGIPRSGTTLAAALLDGLPDTVCLSEPGWHWHKNAAGGFDYRSEAEGMYFAKWLVGDFIDVRRKLLSGIPVHDRRSESGGAVTNYFKKPENGSQKIENVFKIVPMTRSDLSQDFTLAMKHNGPFLSALPSIISLEWFSIVAMVRNPIDVIYSWRMLDLPVSRGKMEDASTYWPGMAALSKGPGEVLEKQVKIYDLICRRLNRFRDSIKILPYESMVAAPNLLPELAGISGEIDAGTIRLSSKTIPEQERHEIVQALKAHGQHYKLFYPDL